MVYATTEATFSCQGPLPRIIARPNILCMQSREHLVTLYVIAQFFFNFDPNSTTFVVPGECFPTRYRSTSHGISAASGKLGTIIAQVVFGPLRTRGALPGAKTPATQNPWINHIMQIFTLFMLCGVFTSLLIPETKRKSLEELAGEIPGTSSFDPFGSGDGANKAVESPVVEAHHDKAT